MPRHPGDAAASPPDHRAGWCAAADRSPRCLPGFFLVLPLAWCSSKRSARDGVAPIFAALAEPDALAAIEADAAGRRHRGAAQPRLRRRRRLGIAKFEFRARRFLITLIDLPFSVSPVVGPGLCAAVRRAAAGSGLAARTRHQDHLRACRASCWRRSSSPSRSSRAN
jgi:hypothetical protein